MLKFLKIKSGFIFVIVLFFVNPSQGFAQDDCLYKPIPQKNPPSTMSKVVSNSGASYFLNNGVYISTLSWNCRRVGKRIYIVVPAKYDDSTYIAKLFASQAELEVAKATEKLIKQDQKNGKYEFAVELSDFEFGSLTIDRSFYEVVYTLLYYTSD